MVIRCPLSPFLSYPLSPQAYGENSGGLLDSRAKVGKRGRGASWRLNHSIISVTDERNKLYNPSLKSPAASKSCTVRFFASESSVYL